MDSQPEDNIFFRLRLSEGRYLYICFHGFFVSHRVLRPHVRVYGLWFPSPGSTTKHITMRAMVPLKELRNFPEPGMPLSSRILNMLWSPADSNRFLDTYRHTGWPPIPFQLADGSGSTCSAALTRSRLQLGYGCIGQSVLGRSPDRQIAYMSSRATVTLSQYRPSGILNAKWRR